MSNLTAGQLHALAVAVGFTRDEARTAAAIALAESGGNPAAVGDGHLTTSKWGPSIGLWQVRSLNEQRGTGKERDATRLTDPGFNARAARIIYLQRGSFRDWSAYNSGAYGKHLRAVDQALAGGGGASKSIGDHVNDMPGVPNKVGNLVDKLPVVDAIGNAGELAGGGALAGLDAMGNFFGSLAQRGTWVRVGQVLGGVLLVAGGLVWLGKDVAAPALGVVSDVVPQAKALKIAGAAGKVASAAGK